MKAVLQRVSSASVTISEKIVAQIDNGLLILVGIEDADNQEDIHWLSQKIVNLRIFASPTPALPEGEGAKNDVMNFSVKDIQGDVIVVSQFTLHANTKKEIVRLILKHRNPKLPFHYMRILFNKWS